MNSPRFGRDHAWCKGKRACPGKRLQDGPSRGVYVHFRCLARRAAVARAPGVRSSRMANRTTFIVQAFERKRGRLVPGARDVAPTANGALKRAEALANRAVGTAAISVSADDETGEVSAAEVLGQFGEVPEDFADTLRGG